MKNFFAILAFSLFPFISFSQSNFQPGYIVNNQGDTLKGYIDYKERNVNPVKVVFKPQLDRSSQVFTINDCAAYGVHQFETFQRFVVNISESRENNGNLSHGLDTSVRRDTVFLKVLQSGENVILYAYQDVVKKRFYMLDKYNKTPEELKRNIYIRDGNRPVVVTDNQFVRQLQDIKRRNNTNKALDEGKWMDIRYLESDLTQVAAEINEQEIVKAGLAATRFFIGGGLNVSKAKYSGENALAGDGAVNKTSYLPFLTVGIDMFANPAIKKIIYRAELSFLMGKYEMLNAINVGSGKNGGSINAEHVFDQYTAQLTPQVIFNMYNTNKLKFFTSAGLSFNLSHYGKNTGKNIPTYNNYREIIIINGEDLVELINFNFSARLHAGLVPNKRLEISAGYHLPSAITQYGPYNIVIQRLTFGVNFLINKD